MSLRAGAAFFKAHGLGNDYLVFEEGDAWPVVPAAVGAVCDRWRGVGSDGIVVVLATGDERTRVRMFNPDGSEFERSGNGLRILGVHLGRSGRVQRGRPFEVEVGGDVVRMTLHAERAGTWDVSVEMGTAAVGPGAVGWAQPPAQPPLPADARDVRIDIGEEPLDATPVRVGNPHLVVFGQPLRRARLEEVGPVLTAHPRVPAGANVQLAEVTGPGLCRALIWERGVGHTSASGTSACAVAVAAVSRGLVQAGEVRVEMEGGALSVEVDQRRNVVLRGPVGEVAEGVLSAGVLAALANSG